MSIATGGLQAEGRNAASTDDNEGVSNMHAYQWKIATLAMVLGVMAPAAAGAAEKNSGTQGGTAGERPA
jgi:hypothetical protein